jgi:hypothetical protein
LWWSSFCACPGCNSGKAKRDVISVMVHLPRG